MEASNEDDFEKQWQDAFEDAELEPSPTVWTGVEKQLPLPNPKVSKIRAVRYVLLFASLFLLILTSYFWGASVRSDNQVNSLKFTVDSSQLNSDSVKNSQNIDNQINSRQSTVDSPQLNSDSVKNSQKIDNQANRPQSAANSPLLNSNPQNIDNQINSRQSKVHSPQLNSDLVKNSQNSDNQINSRQSTVDSPQLNSDIVKNSQNSDNQINSRQSTVDSPQLNSDSVKNSRNIDNQINSRQATVHSPQLNSDSVKNSQNIDNQLISKNNSKSLVKIQLLDRQKIKDSEATFSPLIINNKIFSENTENHSPKLKNRFSLAISFMPNVFQPNLSADYSQYLAVYLQTHQVNNVSTQDFFSDLREENQKNLSYSLNANFAYRLDNRWKVRIGLQYLYDRINQQTNGFFIDYKSGEINSFIANMVENQITNPNFVQAIHNHPSYQANNVNVMTLNNFNNNGFINIQSDYHFLSVPLQAGYMFLPQNRLNFTVWLGAGMDIFLANRNKSNDLSNVNNFNLQKSAALNPINWNILGNLEINYAYNNHWSLVIEPSYRSSLKSYSKSNTMLQFKPSNLGLGLGIKYHF